AIQHSTHHKRLFYSNGKNRCSSSVKSIFFKKKNRSLPAVQKPLPSLSFCLMMDLLGYTSFVLPFFGELFDLIWAPVSALVYWRTFGGAKGFFGGGFAFLEEFLPGTDIIPT